MFTLYAIGRSLTSAIVFFMFLWYKLNMDMFPDTPSDDQPESFPDYEPDYEFDSQKKEVMFLAELTVSGLELADAIEVSRHEVVAKQATIVIDHNLIRKLPSELIPDGLESMINKNNLGIVVEFSWQYSGERPSLKFLLLDEERGDSPVLVIERSSADAAKEDDFGGSFINTEGTELPVRLNSDDLGALIEELISAKDVVINDEGAINTRLLKELVADPQYPPIARFIQDTLIEKGCSYVLKEKYDIQTDDKIYPVEITRENGKTTSIEITDIFASDVEINDGEVTHHERGIIAHISAEDLSISIQFSKLENGKITAYQADSGDRLRLTETIELLSENLK